MNKYSLYTMLIQRMKNFLFKNYAMLDDPEIKSTLMDLITYKAICSLYTITKETEQDITWEELLDTIIHNKEFLDATEAVILYAIQNLITTGNFRFNIETIPWMSLFPKSNEPGIKDNNMQFVKLFPQGQDHFLVEILFASTEIAFYNYQLSKRNVPNLSWEKYIEELSKVPLMFGILRNAFFDAINRLDFTAGWLSNELEEVQFLHKPQSK